MNIIIIYRKISHLQKIFSRTEVILKIDVLIYFGFKLYLFHQNLFFLTHLGKSYFKGMFSIRYCIKNVLRVRTG